MVNWRIRGGMMGNEGAVGLGFNVANMVARNYATVYSVRALAL